MADYPTGFGTKDLIGELTYLKPQYGGQASSSEAIWGYLWVSQECYFVELAMLTCDAVNFDDFASDLT